MAKKKKAGKIYYVCDRTACAHCSPDCKHTSNVAHAKNFAPADINGNYPVKAADAVIFIERADAAPLPPDGGTDAATDKGGGQ